MSPVPATGAVADAEEDAEEDTEGHSRSRVSIDPEAGVIGNAGETPEELVVAVEEENDAVENGEDRLGTVRPLLLPALASGSKEFEVREEREGNDGRGLGFSVHA